MPRRNDIAKILVCIAAMTGCAFADAQIAGIHRMKADTCSLSSPSGGRGTVSGVVTNAVTGHLVPFAHVTLESFGQVQKDIENLNKRVPDDENNGDVMVTAGPDGAFFATCVPEGKYYAEAWAPGFLTQGELLQMAFNRGEKEETLLKGVPQLAVVSQHQSELTLTLTPGGALSGRVEWPNGDPVSDIAVFAVGLDQSVEMPPILRVVPSGPHSLDSPADQARTDDRGAFRLFGLPAGDYLLVVDLPSRAQLGYALFPQMKCEVPEKFKFKGHRLYAPGVFLRSEAKTISIKAGEQQENIRIRIDLGQLHTITGRVDTPSREAEVVDGLITIKEAGVTLFAFNGAGRVMPDGTFTVRDVPAGNYELTFVGAHAKAASTGAAAGPHHDRLTPLQVKTIQLKMPSHDLDGVVIASTQ